MDWSYGSWASGEPYEWEGNTERGHTVWDAMEYHLDLGCGRVKKARIGIDRYPAPGVNILMDLDTLQVFAMAPEPNRDAAERVERGWRYHSPDRPEGEPFLLYPSSPVKFYDISHGRRQLPFEENSIESIISHHSLEHIGDGFLRLIDEVYRVLKPGGIFYAITPLFPSTAAVADADHCRYFMETTWDAFCGTPGDDVSQCWLGAFSVPYTTARFKKMHQDITAPTAPHLQWTAADQREIRVALKAVK